MSAVAALIVSLVEAVIDIFKAHQAGDVEAERQAILRANRLTSDELARREANE